MDERTAIQFLKMGDMNGLEFLVLRYQVKALRAANFITRDLKLAEDVVQDCFLRLPRAIGSFDSSRPFEPWLMRGVLRAAVKAAQRDDRNARADTEADEIWLENLLGSAPSAEAEVEALEFQRRILDALQSLSPRQRAVLVQRYFLGWSEKEMSAELGVAAGTVKWLLNRARSRLQAVFSKGAQDER